MLQKKFYFVYSRKLTRERCQTVRAYICDRSRLPCWEQKTQTLFIEIRVNKKVARHFATTWQSRYEEQFFFFLLQLDNPSKTVTRAKILRTKCVTNYKIHQDLKLYGTFARDPFHFEISEIIPKFELKSQVNEDDAKQFCHNVFHNKIWILELNLKKLDFKIHMQSIVCIN